MYRLMIKTHNKTNLKYLCITARKDWEKYTGSGIYWKKHLLKHGVDFSTELIFESEDYLEFVIVCIETSQTLNAALSEEFANLVPETGYNNKDGKPNVVLFWEYATQEIKNDIIKKRSISIKNNHWTKSNERSNICKKISSKHVETWAKLTLDERRELMDNLWCGRSNFYNNKNTEKYKNWKQKVSESIKTRMANIPFEILSERNRKQRLNMTEEKKAIRKEKIRKIYATGKHQKIFDRYSIERVGVKNPAAKKITLNGIKYGSVQEAAKATGIAPHKIYTRRRKNENVEIY